uniref:Movement protein TGBp3 n=1 Tax=Foxtail mosaic virus TaxID=12179 RepID=TGB3_FXMV|nr:RecName: Full=Movement protein TGBp3; AltName: Full=7 kDa protein; AltName: Full=Triple gene block 3 protein; Short=TGBp3 [Foxtail mosaic virus]ABW25051.1 6K protein [Foxtail mosaic virus]ABW25057.1 6K protein [Foxtail mosaic virus]
MHESHLVVILALLLLALWCLSTRPVQPSCHVEINGHSIIVTGNCWHSTQRPH